MSCPEILKEITVRKIKEHDEMPYDLLLDADPSREIISSYLGVSEVYVALFENNIIGIFVLYPVDPETVEIKNIAVSEHLQGQGIGKLLLRHADQIALSKGVKKIDIATSNASFVPLYLYQKMGFNMTRLKKNFITDYYPKPIFDDGIECKHMIVLTKYL